ncbi:MAG: DnaK suppressor protein [Actinomycetota bacterium]|jgi:RNA polymerase-binding transcription factor DksA|nr:DnaK suppressor protein [Actinomycetota bacterium]
MTDDRWDTQRARLQEELVSLEQQLKEHGVDPQGEGIEVAVDEGFADSAQATTERSELLALIEQLGATRSEVRAALKRLEDGTYGTCVRCGKDIPPGRLEAIPAASLCLECKQLEG